MPFIRYMNNDDVEFADHPCSCGRQHRLISKVLGRSADSVELRDGSKVHGVFFTDVFYEIDEDVSTKIQRFQVFQRNDKSVELRVEKTPALDHSFLKKLEDALPRFLSEFEIVLMDRLPHDKSGKFRYVMKEEDAE
mgnify:CR=1 FL=1